ncbi:MAG: FtsX-like permease family protein [Anaerolineales bacterium]
MGAVWEKVKADLVSRPLISLLVLITIVAAAMLLTLALATLMNLSAPYDKAFEELNAAHLWLYFDREQVSARDLERIRALPAVEETTELRYSMISRVRIHDTKVWTSLRVLPAGAQPEVNRVLVREGRYLAPREEQILASVDLDDLYDLEVGDSIGVTRSDGREVALPIVGLAFNPMWDTYRNSQPPYLYVSEETLQALFPDEETWGWSLGLRLTRPEAVEEVLAQVEATLPEGALEGHTDWRDVKRAALFGARLNFIFLGAFGLFAVLATVFVVVSTMSAIVLSQFREIGILKAVGFTGRQILLLYVGQYLLLALVGSVLGLFLGNLLAPLPLQSIAVSLSTTYEPPLTPGLVTAVLLTVPGVVVLATLLVARRGARANIVRAIDVGAEPPRKKPSLPVRLATRAGLPMVFVLGLNDVFARPFRSLLTGFSLTLGVMGVVFGITLSGTLDTYRSDPRLLGIVYDAAVSRDRWSDPKTRHYLERAPGLEAYYAEALVDVETAPGQTFQVRAVEGDLGAFPFVIEEGRFFRPGTHEVIAGRGLLDWLGLEVGDEITLFLDERKNRPVSWRIVGQYPEPVNSGEMLMMSLPAVRAWQRDVEPRTYFLRLAPGANLARLERYLEPRADSDLHLTLVSQAIPDVVVYLQLAIFALSAILVAIALVNVFNTSLLAVQEKLRAVGVLKTLGMTPGQVIVMINTTAGVLGIIAVGVGLPLGLLLTRTMLVNLSNSYGLGRVHFAFNPLYFLILPPLMVGVSVLGSLLPARRAARHPIVNVLRKA